MNTTSSVRMLLGSLAVLCCSLMLAGAALGQDSERHYIMMLGDSRAGWMRETVTTSEGRITTSANMEFNIKRGPIEISIVVETEFVETEAHEPVSMRSRQVMGSIPVVTEYEFGTDAVTVKTRQSDREIMIESPLPAGDWVTPARASELMAAALKSGDGSITISLLDPTVGLSPITTTRSGAEEVIAEALGKSVPAYRVTTTTSMTPGTPTTEYLDLEGNLLRSTTAIGGMEIVTIAADKELAMAEIDAPEMMRGTFIEPDRVIADPRRAARGVYRLTATEGDLADIPTTGSQSIERVDDRTLRVTVDAKHFHAAGREPDDDDLASTTMIACADEAVAALVAKSGAGEHAPAAVRAEAHRRFVHSFVDEKSLSVGFATASEVARTRVGDCSEHAILLAAVLRADGIPSRVISGLVYARDFIGSKDIFGYHMWTQAWIETEDGPRWVDLDATLPEGRPYDATHIALFVSSMTDDDSINAMVALAPLMGRLEVAVEDIE